MTLKSQTSHAALPSTEALYRNRGKQVQPKTHNLLSTRSSNFQVETKFEQRGVLLLQYQPLHQ